MYENIACKWGKLENHIDWRTLLFAYSSYRAAAVICMYVK